VLTPTTGTVQLSAQWVELILRAKGFGRVWTRRLIFQARTEYTADIDGEFVLVRIGTDEPVRFEIWSWSALFALIGSVDA